MTRLKHRLLLLSLAAAIALAGCSADSSAQADDTQAGTSAAPDAIVLNGDSISCANDGVQIDGSDATIVAPGTYTITGTLDDGQITVNTAGSVTLVLDNANITCMDNAPVNIAEADAVTIQLQSGSINTATDGSVYTADSTAEIDAAIYSKADLVIDGTGSLTVTGNYNDGIASRDTLHIKGGSISVNAANHGIKGKDYLMVDGGNITIGAGKDGMKATNDIQAEMGYIEINDGSIDISSGDEGISAIGAVTVNGGGINIDCSKAGIKSDTAGIDIQGGTINVKSGKDALSAQSVTGSPNAQVTVNGSAVTL